MIDNKVNDYKQYGENNIRENYRKLTRLLIFKGLTITTMESATSGQIASLITDTEGSSAVFKGAFVTYCNEASTQSTQRKLQVPWRRRAGRHIMRI